MALLMAILFGPRRVAATAPDPARGERLDGRHGTDLTGTDVALAVPRLVLMPPRLVIGLLGRLGGLLVKLDDDFRMLYKIRHLVTSEDGLVGLRPILDYATGFYPIGGFALFDDRTAGRGSHMEIDLAAGLPRLLRVDTAFRPALKRRYQLDLGIHYTRRDDLVFRGVGLASTGGFKPNHTPNARYGVDAVDAGAQLRVAVSRHALVRVGESWSWRRYSDGRDVLGDADPITELYCNPGPGADCALRHVDVGQVPGYYTGANFFATDAELVVDTRAALDAPQDGARLELGLRYAHGVGAVQPSWIHARASLTGAVSLRGPTRALLFRLQAHLLESFGQDPVPFTELVTLGGVDDLRGFPLGRFRDYTSVLATIEYRYRVWLFMDVALFTDLGGTFGRRFAEIAFDRLVPDLGAAVLLHTRRKFIVRLQLAYGFGQGMQFAISSSTGL
jgi:outer membrane protein assembly factor BamA